MSNKTKITDYKTKRINEYTEGCIKDYYIPDYPLEGEDSGLLSNSFLSQSGEYIGAYDIGWWYYKNNLKVCEEYPHGVAMLVRDIKLPSQVYNLDGYYGYTHRGGCSFKIGDKLFDENYKPKKEDYSDEEWAGWEKSREESISRDIAEGWYANKEEALKKTEMADYVPFTKRGFKIIETLDEALQAAKNMSSHLS